MLNHQGYKENKDSKDIKNNNINDTICRMGKMDTPCCHATAWRASRPLNQPSALANLRREPEMLHAGRRGGLKGPN